jgi:hypothetical protein
VSQGAVYFLTIGQQSVTAYAAPSRGATNKCWQRPPVPAADVVSLLTASSGAMSPDSRKPASRVTCSHHARKESQIPVRRLAAAPVAITDAHLMRLYGDSPTLVLFSFRLSYFLLAGT